MVNEKENLTGSARVFWWRPAAWLRVTGTDAFIFLQGQFSNDLRQLERTEAVYGLWLDHKGRVQADGFIIKGQTDEWWIGSYFSPASTIRERLESFIVADDVTVTDETNAWSAVTLIGAPVAAAAAGVLGFSGRRGYASAREWLYPGSGDDRMRELLRSMATVTAGEMERARISAGIPAIPADIGPGELPNEAGLEDAALSYTKGCYLGQEVMARLKSMGRVRRRLVRVRGGAGTPAVPAPLFQGGRKVAELRSSSADDHGFIGLALVSLLHLQRGQPLELSPTENKGSVNVLDPL